MPVKGTVTLQSKQDGARVAMLLPIISLVWHMHHGMKFHLEQRTMPSIDRLGKYATR